MNTVTDGKMISAEDEITLRNMLYFRKRQKNKVFQTILAYFVFLAKNDGLTKKELAKRLDKEQSQITRWFASPGNWTLDTISDLLFGMGAEMKYEISPIPYYRKKPLVISHDVYESHTPRKTISRTELSIYEIPDVIVEEQAA